MLGTIIGYWTYNNIVTMLETIISLVSILEYKVCPFGIWAIKNQYVQTI